MKVALFILLFSLISCDILSQHLLPVQHDTLFEKGSFGNELILSGNAEYLSTSIENQLAKKLLYGGEILDGDKYHSFGQHRAINRLGADVTAELEYKNYQVNCFKKEQLGFLVKAGYYNYASLIYGKDLFGLAFFGNEKYLGETVDFSGTRFLGMSFQKMSFGFFNKQSKNAITLNMYSISGYSEGSIYAGQLFQSAMSDSVSLALTGNVDYASTTAFSKGIGAGVDLDFRLPVKMSEKHTAVVRFEAKNLGICTFNQSLTRYQADTIVHFNGYTLDQLLSSSNGTSGKPQLMDTLGIDSVGIRKWRFLPAFIQIGKIVSDSDPSPVQSFYGIRMYGLSAFAPMVYGGIQYKLAKFADLGMSAAVGGFGRLRFGLYSNWKFGNCYMGIGSENLTGIFQKNAMGESISLRFRCIF